MQGVGEAILIYVCRFQIMLTHLTLILQIVVGQRVKYVAFAAHTLHKCSIRAGVWGGESGEV